MAHVSFEFWFQIKSFVSTWRGRAGGGFAAHKAMNSHKRI